MEPEQHFLVSRPGPQLSRLALPPVHLLLAPGLAVVDSQNISNQCDVRVQTARPHVNRHAS